MSSGNIAKRWRELSGQNHWNGLLNPLDKDLRQYLLHYGDMEQATYDTFIKENTSKFAGSSRFPMSNLLAGAGKMSKDQTLMKYKVTKYLYATTSGNKMSGAFMRPTADNAWSKDSNWMGFIAVATDEGKKVLGRRDIVVAWRGTIKPEEWEKDYDGQMDPAPIFNSKDNPTVHQGFYSVYTSKNPGSQYTKTSARDQANAEVHRLVEEYKNDELSVTVLGHSLGGAMAILNAADIVANGLTRPRLEWAKKGALVTVFAFASPRVGDGQFRKTLNDMGVDTNSQQLIDAVRWAHGGGMLRVLRIVNKNDPVPNTPPPIAGFTHVGQVFNINTSMSPYLKNPPNVAAAHDMEAYLHGIAGVPGSQNIEEDGGHEEEHGGGGNPGFKLMVNRDIALVNKYTDSLKSEYNIPEKWWTSRNGGMQLNNNGKWEMAEGNWINQKGNAEHEDDYEDESEED